ncbi:putative septum site-determining protein MinC [Candidatus Magnetomoraceae bacterium gMMP-15]
MNTEKSPVKIKGVGDSLWVSVDTDQPPDVIEKELEALFKRLGHLTIQAKVVLDIEKKGKHQSLISHLRKFLKDRFSVASVIENEKPDPDKPKKPRAQDWKKNWRTKRSDVLMITGRIRSGQKIRARKHLVVMGDVNPGGEAMSGGDILVIGSLRGKAVAGQPNNTDAIILALDFKPTQVQIGSVVAVGIDSESPGMAEYARVEGENIVVEDYLHSNPFAKLHWPEIR